MDNHYQGNYGPHTGFGAINHEAPKDNGASQEANIERTEKRAKKNGSDKKIYRRIEKHLKAPFPAKEVEWRVQQSGMKSNGEPYALVLAYITNRAIMDRLDKVMTPFGWQNEFRELSTGSMYCRIGLRIGDTWIWKGDGAGETNIEAKKGAYSDAMKRAAYQWGIGRYLYKLDAAWANFTDSGTYKAKINGDYYRWSPPKLPGWALPNS